MSGSHVFVLLILFMVFTMVIIKSWLSKPKTAASVDDGDVKEMLEKIEILEERIRVLERIVTENKIDLKQQIDNL